MDPRKIPLAAVLVILSLTVIVFLVVALFSNTAEAPAELPREVHEDELHEHDKEHEETEEYDEHAHEHGSPYPLQTYTDDLFAFEYPAYVMQQENTKGAYAWLTYPHEATGEAPREEAYLSINRIEVTETSFNEYVANFRDWLEADATAFNAVESQFGMVHEVPAMTEARFALATTTVNGLPVMLEKSNYGGASGKIYFMTVWLGDGTVLQFLSEYHDATILELTYQSVRPVE